MLAFAVRRLIAVFGAGVLIVALPVVAAPVSAQSFTIGAPDTSPVVSCAEGAYTTVWEGSYNSDFNDGLNWSNGTPSSATACVPVDSLREPELTSGSVTMASLDIENGKTLLLRGNSTLTLTSDLTSAGEVIIDSASLVVGADSYVGDLKLFSANVTGPSVTVARSTSLVSGTKNIQTALTLTGATSWSAGDIVIDGNGSLTNRGAMTVNGAGSLDNNTVNAFTNAGVMTSSSNVSFDTPFTNQAEGVLNVTTGQLSFPNARGFVQAGSINLANGAVLNLLGSAFTQSAASASLNFTGGLMLADAFAISNGGITGVAALGGNLGSNPPVQLSGDVHVRGSLNTLGALTIDGGHLDLQGPTPEDTEPLVVADDFTMNSGTVTVDLLDAADTSGDGWDWLNVFGNADFNGGVIKVRTPNGDPALGTTFRVGAYNSVDTTDVRFLDDLTNAAWTPTWGEDEVTLTSSSDPDEAPQYRFVGADGSVYAYGSSNLGSPSSSELSGFIVGLAETATGDGYLLAGNDGGVFAYGEAQFQGSMGGARLSKPIVGIASNPSGTGYWLVASDGGVFAFGDAAFHGSTGGQPLNQPVVRLVPTATGEGYFLIARDGGVFAYGDARFQGSLGGQKLNAPIVAAGMSSDGTSYTMVASDGGVFAFGGPEDFHGSLGGQRINAPIVDIRFAVDGTGYWLIAADGGVFAFNAPFLGSAAGMTSSVVTG